VKPRLKKNTTKLASLIKKPAVTVARKKSAAIQVKEKKKKNKIPPQIMNPPDL
jgi:hypothetical protein